MIPKYRHVIETLPVTDPSVLRILLRVNLGWDPAYDWVECNSCGAGWQVPHYAESLG